MLLMALGFIYMGFDALADPDAVVTINHVSSTGIEPKLQFIRGAIVAAGVSLLLVMTPTAWLNRIHRWREERLAAEFDSRA